MVMAKKKKIKKGKIIGYIFIVIALLTGYFIAIHMLTAFIFYTDENTELYSGKINASLGKYLRKLVGTECSLKD